MKTLWLIFVTSLLTLNCFAQKEYADEINKYDSEGRKTGFWIEDWGSGWRRELYYQNGVMHGNYKIYNEDKKLLWFGNYENGNEIGIWYHFKNSGHLVSTTKDFLKKDHVIVGKDGSERIYRYQCYFISYHDNGEMESEGLMIWNHDPYTDSSHKYGKWKYFNEDGKLLETKIYK